MPATVPSPSVGLDAQYRAVREGAGLRELTDRSVIRLTGAESAEFLQGQLTNDVEALAPGEGCYAALLDRKGKMRSDMRVLSLAQDEILVDCPAFTADAVEGHLQMYKVGRQVEVGTVGDATWLSLLGPACSSVLGEVPLGAEHSHRELSVEGVVVRAVTTGLGVDLLLPAAQAGTVAATLLDRGADPITAEAAEIVRVETGRPAYGAEMGPDTIPQEAGINDRAVSFEKGCYIGQETVARLHYKGKPNRHLRRLISDEPLTAGAPVVAGDREVGAVGAAVISPARGPLALAILRREAEPGAEVDAGGIRATVEEVGP